MGIKVKKTSHAGAKKGQGAYWGPKKWAKSGSKRLRREEGKKAVRQTSQTDSTIGNKPL